jgi:hypothetical protein
MPGKVKRYDRSKSVKRIARDRVGAVPASRPIEPKVKRKRPKYKQPLVEEEAG